MDARAVFEPQAMVDRPPRRVRTLGAPIYRASITAPGLEGERKPNTFSRSTLAPLEIPGAGAGQSRGGPEHPFEQDGFTSGLLSAGYFGTGPEMFDLSRKKIKARFSHGLAKQNVSSTSALIHHFRAELFHRSSNLTWLHF